MADLAAKPERRRAPHLRQHPSALRTGQRHGISEPVGFIRSDRASEGDGDFQSNIVGGRRRGIPGLAREHLQEPAKLADRGLIVDIARRQRRQRHLALPRLNRILYDGHAAAAFEIRQSGGAVVQHARQNDTDGPRAVTNAGRPEQGIDGWPREIFPGAPA